MDKATMKDADHLLREDVVEELGWSPDVNDTQVGVSVLNGAVSLSGQVASQAERKAAVRTAMRVAGVRVVADELEVRDDSPHRHTDADIAAAINNILKWTSKNPESSVQVEVRDHVAILTGTVNHQFQRRDLAKLVRDVIGVQEVQNSIDLSARASAEDTQNDIKRALIRNATTDAAAIHVTAVGTEVTLTGSVRTWLERSEAARAAWASPHVTDIHNKIQVRA
ncbi:MAG: BON domain-containing protein [Aeromicrobium sp.]